MTIFFFQEEAGNQVLREFGGFEIVNRSKSWACVLCFYIAFGLAIFPAFLISNLPAQGPMRDGMIDILQIIWVASSVVGLIILAKGVMLTMARLEKAGRIPD